MAQRGATDHRLVLIGQDLDATQLEARLRQALGA